VYTNHIIAIMILNFRMKILEPLILVLKNTANQLKGMAKRQFMAEAVNSFGKGGQRAAARQLGWCRNTIMKGQNELRTGINCIDNFSGRGRKKAEELNPDLIKDIQSIVEGESQADPSLKSERIYLKITAPEVRRQLQERFHYSNDMLPALVTIKRKLNDYGYHLRKVRKTLPKKNSQKPMTFLPI
jgi:hypothetical protein